MKNIAIFASGEGSNAEAIARYFTNSNNVCVKCGNTPIVTADDLKNISTSG